MQWGREGILKKVIRVIKHVSGKALGTSLAWRGELHPEAGLYHMEMP